MAIITNIQPIDPNNFEFQDYDANDVNLINEKLIETSFTQTKDYIEYHVYDLSNQLISSQVGFNVFSNFRLLDNNLVLDPLQDIQNLELDGTYNAVYNFLTPLLGSNSSKRYYISQISSDRTEIRLDTTQISLTETDQGRTVEGTGVATGGVVGEITDFISKFQNESLTQYPDFYLNFGENQLALAVNIQLDESDLANPTILIKLYESLPSSFDLKTELWVVEKRAESVAFQVENTETFDLSSLNIPLAGPNINLPIKDRVNNSTEPQSINNIENYYTASVENQLLNRISQSGVTLNTDYTEYENFVFFSSAQTRLNNFVTKLENIEKLEVSASLISSSLTSSVLTSEIVYRNQIKDIVTNFDDYEYFLYFTSGSKSWPKLNTTIPFENVASSSAEASGFYDSQSFSASAYDEDNINKLSLAIPEYIREDPQNSKFTLFVEMAGQHFDSIKIYQDAITEKYNTNPSLTAGLSKDLVGDAIQDFGLKLYQSSFTNQELFSYVVGVGTSGSLLPPTGSEVITNYVSASNSNIPVDDAIKGNYKKIYHALPSLLKRKGTLRGLRELINTFGVPDTVLRISEFGGKDKIAIDDYDYSENQFNFALQPSASGFINHTFRDTNNNFSSSDSSPQTWALRINPGLLPTSSIPHSQSIATNREIFDTVTTGSFSLVLEYSASAYTTSSLISSSFDPISSSYQYANLKLIVSGSGSSDEAVSASISLPFYDGGWWSIMVRHEDAPVTDTDVTYSLFAKNDIPTENGTKIGFQASSTVIAKSWETVPSASIDYPSNVTSSVIAGKTYTNSNTLQYQEIRWYDLPLSESSFNSLVTNPYSIEGNSLQGANSSQNTLTFRAPLGTVLDYDTPKDGDSEFYQSIHPSATKFVPTSSWEGGEAYENAYEYVSSSNINIISNTERIYLDSPGVGVRSRNSDKIRAINLVAPTGSALSQYITIEQSSPISESYTPDVDYLEVGFSPSNELNDDIIAQFGNFNIGDFIGDPRQASSSNTTYPDFDKLKNQYFEKFATGSLVSSSNVDVSYNVYDFIRLAKFFDNSLFKMIKDFVPARTSLSTGVIVKPHILERTKHPQPNPSFEELLFTGSVKSFPLGYETGSLLIPSGGDGGFLNLTPIDFTQSFTFGVTGISGSSVKTQSDAREFVNGEYSGSEFVITNGELNVECDPFKSSQTKGAQFIPKLYLTTEVGISSFLNDNTTPNTGEIYLLFDDEDVSDLPEAPQGRTVL